MNRTVNIIIGLLFPLLSFAHGPTPQQANETIIINAPVENVWSAVKQFDEISTWHPDVKNSTGDGKNESGGIRVITLENAEQFTEELDYYSDQEHKYKYRIKTENVKALPVSSHSSSLQVTAGDEPNTSVVSIKSRFYRGDTSNSPAEQLNDEAAVKAMTAFFKNGLIGLQKKLTK
ncbi:MAG: SRPBCC family protein [Methylococcales bacterium]|nr:SRPBCC family protein [Methylococcales bacterium]